MSTDITPHNDRGEIAWHGIFAPEIVAAANRRTQYHLVEYLTAHIRNQNTRATYARRLKDFSEWFDVREISDLVAISSVQVAAYVEEMMDDYVASTVKQALAAIRMMIDHLAAPFLRSITTQPRPSAGRNSSSARAKRRP